MWYTPLIYFFFAMADVAQNVNGLINLLKCEAIFQNLNQSKHTIVFLQETRLNLQTITKVIFNSTNALLWSRRYP